MKLLDALRKMAGREPRIYGTAPTNARTSYRWLAATSFDYATEAGDVWLNAVVMPALSLKASAINECRLCVEKFDGKKWDETTDAGAQRLLGCLAEPNDDYDGAYLWGGQVLSDDVRGNGFWIKRQDNIGRLAGFRWVPQFAITPSSTLNNADGMKFLTHYVYTPGGGGTQQFLMPETVVHIRHAMPDPRDPRLALSPLNAVLREICTDNELATWEASITRQGAVTQLLSPKVDVGKSPNESQKIQLRDMINRYIRDKRGVADITPLPLDVIKIGMTPAEMDIEARRAGPTARLCAALGGDPMAFGLPSPNKTYSNYAEAIDALGKRAIIPAMQRWARQVGHQCFKDPGIELDPKLYRLKWDTCAVSWLQDETDNLHERVRSDFNSNLIDRARAKELIGEPALPDDVGVYAWMLKPVPVAPTPAKQAELMRARAEQARKDLERFGL